jgi:hypothetical protein
LLRARQSAQNGPSREKADTEPAVHRAMAASRKELNSLVSAYARKSGARHAVVHADLRQSCGGPTLGQANAAQVAERIEMIRRWFVGRR